MSSSIGRGISLSEYSEGNQPSGSAQQLSNYSIGGLSSPHSSSQDDEESGDFGLGDMSIPAQASVEKRTCLVVFLCKGALKAEWVDDSHATETGFFRAVDWSGNELELNKFTIQLWQAETPIPPTVVLHYRDDLIWKHEDRERSVAILCDEEVQNKVFFFGLRFEKTPCVSSAVELVYFAVFLLGSTDPGSELASFFKQKEQTRTPADIAMPYLLVALLS